MPRTTTPASHLLTFLCLYIAQAIPMSFFASVLPVLMRQGDYSLTAIALVKLIKLPWILKFAWSPLVDRHTSTVAAYRRWIIGAELLYALLILVVSFVSVEQHFTEVIVLVLSAFVMSATQDIATDAFAARAFRREDRGLLNSMQSIGSFAGAMVGGGLLLLLYKRMGWGDLLPFVALFVLIALLPLLLHRNITILPRTSTQPARLSDVATFFGQSGIWRHILFLLLFYAGMMGLLSNLRPMLVDLGYDMSQIGLMVGIFGTGMGMCGSMLSGIGIRHLGRDVVRRVAALSIVCAALYFYYIYSSGMAGSSVVWLYTGIGLVWFTYGISTTLMYTTSMDLVREGREGTDFTLQIVLTHLSSMLFAIGCSRIADRLGYEGMFVAEMIIGTIAVVYVWRYKPINRSK